MTRAANKLRYGDDAMTERGQDRHPTGGTLNNGDRVCGHHNGELGVILAIESGLVRVRVDSSGQILSSAACLWSKR